VLFDCFIVEGIIKPLVVFCEALDYFGEGLITATLLYRSKIDERLTGRGG
jgi:hypothetical protein